MTTVYERGAVVKGPDLLADNDYRPYVCLSDHTHPFHDEEALYAAATTTRRAVAIPLTDDDFVSGGLPRESYVNPWTVVTIRHVDMECKEGHLIEVTTEKIATETLSISVSVKITFPFSGSFPGKLWRSRLSNCYISTSEDASPFPSSRS